MPRLLRLLAACAAGAILALAFPDHDVWWTPPIAVAVFALSTDGVRARFGTALGLVFGLAFFLPTLSWSGVYVGVFPWSALALLQASYFALMGAALAAVQRRRIAPFVGACLWVTQEWLRSTTPFGGFPWARLSFSQADAPWAPLVAWVSAPGLTFTLALAGGALAARAGAAMGEARRLAPASTSGEGSARRPTIAAKASVLASAVAAVALLLAGCLIRPDLTGPRMKVAGIQGNVPTEGLDFNAQRRAVLDNHVAATESLATRIDAGSTPRPDLVVWPENASDIDPKRNPDAAAQIDRALRAVKTPLVVGAVLSEPLSKVSNASMLFLPGRGLSDTYVKQHPVPFGEYIPYRSFFRTFSSQVDLVRADFTQGRSVGLFDIPTAAGVVKVAPIICFEVAYDDLLRKPADRGAQLFLVQTNNATFGHTAESTQQLAISRMRALEYGRSIAHVSTVGISALITPDGATHERSSLFTRAVLTGELPLHSAATPAQRLGRAPEVIAAFVSVSALAVCLVTRRRTRRVSGKSSDPVER